MGFRQARIWQWHVFKQISLFGSSPHRVLPVAIISETGYVSLEQMPTITGLVMLKAAQMGWAVIQKLKVKVPGIDQPVLFVSEKSFMPLDPLGILTDEEKKQLGTVNELAQARYDEERSKVDAENREGNNTQMVKTILYLMALILLAVLMLTYAKGCQK